MLPCTQQTRRLTTDPDAFFGPGGLSARQIFDKVQQSRAKEANAAREQQQAEAQQRQKASGRVLKSDADLSAASSKELREALVAHGVDVSDCFERSDLLSRARSHLL